jgi:hypothetical protein
MFIWLTRDPNTVTYLINEASIATGYGLDGLGVIVRVPVR